MRRLLVPALLTALAALAAAEEGPSTATPEKDLASMIRSSKGLQSFARLLAQAEMEGVLSEAGPMTVLVPTEAAFTRLGDRSIPKADLRTMIANHVLRGRLDAADLADRSGVRTLAGRRLPIEHRRGVLIVGGAVVKAANVPASNGVLHLISGVLQPAAGNLETAARAGAHATLVALVEHAGLSSLLTGNDTYTLLAPTDSAFERLSAGTLVRLRDPEHRDELHALLRRHVVPGRVYVEDALRSGKLTNLEGEVLPLRLVDSRESIAGAKILESNIEAGNGLVHTIDRVLAR